MSEEEKSFTTTSGIEIKRVYGPGQAGPDTRDSAYIRENIGKAGEAPFTRGIYPTMYRGRKWTMRQYAGFGTASQTNERFKYLLAQGQTGLSTAFDLPTQIGFDADAEKASGEIGRVGVHVGQLDDMRTLLKDIPLGEVSTSMTINSTAAILLALYTEVADQQGIDTRTLRGTVQNDILKEYLARGTYIYPVEHGMRLAVDTITHAVKHFPKWNPISISGYHIREAGSDAAQEIAFTFGNAEAYVRGVLDRGLAVDDFAPRLAFFFGCHNHFLEEIAKFRAARRMWARLMSEEFGAKNPKSRLLRFHTQTCGATLTSQQPRNNVARVALQAMAAMLGGTQSLHTNSYDEALALPTEESAQIALRTQQILAFETGAADTVDPLAGAYAIEALTDELEEKAWALLKKVRGMGGMVPAIEKGWAQQQIQESAYAYQQDIEHKRRKIVGLNSYELKDEDPGAQELLKVSPELEEDQRRRLEAFRKKRDTAKAQQACSQLKKAAADSKENLFPHIRNCVAAEATLGEISAAMREEFGEYHGA
jgi:methylmalonyl-CoA mutase N-terminal domain/subunit